MLALDRRVDDVHPFGMR